MEGMKGLLLLAYSLVAGIGLAFVGPWTIQGAIYFLVGNVGGVLFWWYMGDDRALMLSALNVMFYKVIAPPGYSTDEIGGFWVAELGDKNIKVRWDSEAGGFK